MANSVDPDEMAHYDPSHLDLHCLQKNLSQSAELKGLTFTDLGLIQQRANYDIFLIFPRNQDLTFQSLFSGKNKNNISICLLNFLPSIVNPKVTYLNQYCQS